MKIGIFFGANMPTKNYDYYIATEHGGMFLNMIGITPDIVISDFDSVEKEDIVAKEVKVYPKIKDKSDLDLCLEYAVKLTDNKHIDVYGEEFGRVDHLLYQVNQLSKYPDIKIHYENSIIVCCEQDYEFEFKTKYVSLYLKNAEVETFGLRWELDGIYRDGFFSLSNEFIIHNPKIKIKKGQVIVIYSN